MNRIVLLMLVLVLLVATLPYGRSANPKSEVTEPKVSQANSTVRAGTASETNEAGGKFTVAENSPNRSVAKQTTPSAVGIVGKEHYALRENLKIYLWEKYGSDSLASAAQSGKVILLVHGATWSGRPDFDLQIRDYSLMDYLAKNGCDVWAIDIHGYGHSDRTDKDWSDTNSAASDIAAAVGCIGQTRHVDKVSILGWSWGSLTGGLYAMRHPEKVNRLILYGLVWKGNPNGRKSRIPTEQYRTNTEAAAAADFVEGQYEFDVAAKYVREALATDPKSPNGVIVDIVTKLPILEPKQIKVPTLIIRPEKDFAITESDALEFFANLGTQHKSYVALPDGGHAILFEKNHRMFQQAVLGFLSQP